MTDEPRKEALTSDLSEDQQTESASGAVPFDSLDFMAESHTELFRRQLLPENANQPGFLDEVEEFIEHGRATGVLLESISERQTAQSLLNYWVTVLYRAGDIEPPDTILVPFVEPRKLDLATAKLPYLGLNPFAEADHDRFYGRLGVTERLIERLKDNRLVIFVGPAGSGKTSVVNAGVVPELKSGKKLPGSEHWHYLNAVTPGRDPLKALAAMLAPSDGTTGTDFGPQNERLFADKKYVRQLLDQQFSGQTVLIVIDRFEEVFTLCKNDEQRDAFIANLIELTHPSESSTLTHRVILIIRSDRTNYIIGRSDFTDLYPKAEIRIHPLTESDLREAIKEPARKIGLKFEKGIVAQLIREIYADEMGLPLLQFMLLRLWDEKQGDIITWAAMNRLERCAYALIQTADQWYKSLSATQQEIARLVLLKMVRIIDNLEVVGDRVRREDLYQSGQSPEAVDSVLDGLVNAHLVRITKGVPPVPQDNAQADAGGVKTDTSPDDQFQLVHKSMWLDWEPFTAWLKGLREALVMRQRLESLAVNWVLLGRKDSGLLDKYQLHEAKSWIQSWAATEVGYDTDLAALVARSAIAISKEKFRKSAWLAFTFLLLVGLVIGLYWQYLTKQRADRLELEKVKRESEGAFRVANVLEKMTSEESADRLTALSEIDSLVREQKMPPRIGAAILSIAIRDKDKQVADKAEAIVKQVSKTKDVLAQSIGSAAYGDASLAQQLDKDTLTPRFYIHLATRDQEGRANTIKKALEEKGYIVPPFEVVGGGAPPTNQIRYNSEPETQDPTPDGILALLRAIDSNQWSTKPIASDQLSRGTFEIWLAGQFAQSGRLIINPIDEEGDVLETEDFELFISSLSNPEQRSFRSKYGLVYSLLPGRYSLTLNVRGYRRASRSFSIREASETVVSVPLRPRN